MLCWSPELDNQRKFESLVETTCSKIGVHTQLLLSGQLCPPAFFAAQMRQEAARWAQEIGSESLQQAATLSGAASWAQQIGREQLSDAVEKVLLSAIPVISVIAQAYQLANASWVLYKWTHRRGKMVQARTQLPDSIYALACVIGLQKLIGRLLVEQSVKVGVEGVNFVAQLVDFSKVAALVTKVVTTVATLMLTNRSNLQLARDVDAANQMILSRQPMARKFLRRAAFLASYLPPDEGKCRSMLGSTLVIASTVGKEGSNMVRDAKKGLAALTKSVPAPRPDTIDLGLPVGTWITGDIAPDPKLRISSEQARAFYDICRAADKTRRVLDVHAARLAPSAA